MDWTTLCVLFTISFVPYYLIYELDLEQRTSGFANTLVVCAFWLCKLAVAAVVVVSICFLIFQDGEYHWWYFLVAIGLSWLAKRILPFMLAPMMSIGETYRRNRINLFRSPFKKMMVSIFCRISHIILRIVLALLLALAIF